MRILQLISPSGPYGAESMMVNLAEGLQVLGCESVLGIFRNSQNPHLEVARLADRTGLPLEIIPCEDRVDLSALTSLKECLRRHRIDIVHSHGLKTNFYGYLATRAVRLPIVCTYHSAFEVRRTNLKLLCCRSFDRHLLKRFDKVVAVSKPIAQILQKAGINRHNLEHISNGVNSAHYTAALTAATPDIRGAGGAIVGFVGRLIAAKGPELFLHAAKRVLQQFPDTTFCLIGAGPLRSFLEELARKLAIADRVMFTGVRDDMPFVYPALDMVVLPSLNEGLPMAILEALAARRAVIATEVGGVPAVVRDGDTGLLIPPCDCEALANAILRLVDNPCLRRQLGECGQRFVEARFSSEAMARQYLALYTQLMSHRVPSLPEIPDSEVFSATSS